jgi:hypothetical protein
MMANGLAKDPSALAVPRFERYCTIWCFQPPRKRMKHPMGFGAQAVSLAISDRLTRARSSIMLVLPCQRGLCCSGVQILTGIQNLLDDPNVNDPAQAEAYHCYMCVVCLCAHSPWL